jgi:hypothetical protein
MAGTERTGRIGAVEYEDGTIGVNQDELLQVMQDMAGTLRQVGGMFAITAERVQTEVFEGRPIAQTVGYIWTWRAFSPMQRQQPQQEEEPMPHETEPEPVPEPVEA